MVEYIWLFDRDEKKEMGCSVLGSLIFHSLLLTVLASTNFFYSLPGESENVEILWYYPSLSPTLKTTPAEKPVAAIAKVTRKPSFQTRQMPAPIHGKVLEKSATPTKMIGHGAVTGITPPHPPLPKFTTTTEPVNPPITVSAEEEPEPDTEPEMVIPAAIAPRPEIKAVASNAEDTDAKKPAELEKSKETDSNPGPLTEKQNKPAVADIGESPLKEVKAASPTPRYTAEEAARVPITKTTPPLLAAGKIDTSRSARLNSETAPSPTEAKTPGTKISLPPSFPLVTTLHGQPKSKEAAVVPQRRPQAAELAGETKIPAAGKESKPSITANPAKENKQLKQARTDTPETKGIFFPPVRGDLKLEISGKEMQVQQFKVIVLFREYPKARRSTPMTRSEYKRAQTLTPKLVRSGERSYQAVIEVAGEGIYEFMVDSASEQANTATFTLKLYEKSSRARTRALGSRQITGNESVVKIIMPEGILWGDDDAFSGSFENSDSITKFNTDTGLLWREYR
jgi:hypothetical protein